MYRSLVQCDINFGQTKAEEMKLIDFISKFPDEESTGRDMGLSVPDAEAFSTTGSGTRNASSARAAITARA